MRMYFKCIFLFLISVSQVFASNVATSHKMTMYVQHGMIRGLEISTVPTVEPTVEPSAEPTVEPSAEPSAEPTALPTASPSTFPTTAPTTDPTASPSVNPTTAPTIQPTATPSPAPTTSPSVSPTASPSSDPTVSPSTVPSVSPSAAPTASPTVSPTSDPTITPTVSPTTNPTTMPSLSPTTVPTTPTALPSSNPTVNPTTLPTAAPTAAPSPAPSTEPTCAPTATPSCVPSVSPTDVPTTPTAAPSTSPTAIPTSAPSTAPTTTPTVTPTTAPSTTPTLAPNAADVLGLFSASQNVYNVTSSVFNSNNNATMSFRQAIAASVTGVSYEDVTITSIANSASVSLFPTEIFSQRRLRSSSLSSKGMFIQSATPTSLVYYTISFSASTQSALQTSYSSLSLQLSTSVATGVFTSNLHTFATANLVTILQAAYSNAVASVTPPVILSSPTLAPTLAPTPSLSLQLFKQYFYTMIALAVVAFCMILCCFTCGYCVGFRSIGKDDNKLLVDPRDQVVRYSKQNVDPTHADNRESMSAPRESMSAHENVQRPSNDNNEPIAEDNGVDYGDVYGDKLSIPGASVTPASSSANVGGWFTSNPAFGAIARAFTFVKGSDISIKVYCDYLFGPDVGRSLRYPAYDYSDSAEAVEDLMKFIMDAILAKDACFEDEGGRIELTYRDAATNDIIQLEGSSWENFVHQKEKILYVLTGSPDDDRYKGRLLLAPKPLPPAKDTKPKRISSSKPTDTTAAKTNTRRESNPRTPSSAAATASSVAPPTPPPAPPAMKKPKPVEIDATQPKPEKKPAVTDDVTRQKPPPKPAAKQQPSKIYATPINPNVCAACEAPDPKKVCPRCKVTRYCSRDCQVAHWGVHKKECQTLAAQTDLL